MTWWGWLITGLSVSAVILMAGCILHYMIHFMDNF